MDATQPNSPLQAHGDFASGSVDIPSERTASSQNQANVNAKLRKRTKTGCLTCRKRRIKCGEERPICNNCIKSKRQCEGYNPRVIWKPPIGDWPGHPSVAGTLPYHTGVIPGARPPDFQQYRPPGAPNVGSHAPIQPRPAVGQFDFANLESGQIPILTPISPQTPQQYQPYQQPGHPQSFHSHQHAGITYQQQTGEFALQQSPQFHAPQYQYSPDAHPFTTGAQSQAPFQAPFQYPPTSLDYTQPAQQVPHSSPHEFREQTHQYIPTPTTQQPTYSHFRTPETPQEQYHLPQAPSYQHNPSISSETNSHLPSGPQGPPNDHQPNFNYPASYAENEPYTPASVLAQKAHLLPRFDSLDGGHDRLEPEDFDVKPSSEQVFEPQPTRSQVDTQALEAQLMTVDRDRERLSPTEMLNKAAVEYHDDDYYDVESDEDVESAPDQTSFDSPKFQRDFTLIMRLYNKHTSDLAIRRMDAFIYEGILDHYHAEWVANPLKNEHTARVFAHFIHSSAPMLSIHERNPLNTQSMFSKAPVPVSQQSLWTYTLPMMALSNQGLLHAMLAIGSLHIARLQGASITPSFKHYAYALKRIHHSVGHPMKRLQVTTLAASLLLGFYELMTADHLKWSSHLVGAKQLLVEIDYRGMTQSAKAMKAEQAEFDKHLKWDDLSFPPKPRPHASIFRSEMPLPNEEILSTIIGKKLRYDELGHVIGDFDSPYPGSIPNSLDMTKFELFQDLFWWYCRQDAYQSIISGNRLLMDYHRWGDCPPRAPLGRSEAAYATHDHFILMLGRIADFAARDRVRKVKVVESQGGAWKPDPRMFAALMCRPAGGPPSMSPSGPPPGFGMPPSAGASMGPLPSPGYPMASQIASSMSLPQTPISPFSPHGSHGPLGPPGSQQPPPGFPSAPMQPPTPNSTQFPSKPPQGSAPPKIPFYGMAPSSSRVYMPSSYAKDRKLSPEMKSEEIQDLDQALQSALDEWQQINAALNVFASNLGPQFQPLSEEYYQPLSTPFGDAAQYRSYDISNIWALYNMAKIIVIRSHPCMPPAAMMAAGVAAPMTAGLANEIGRIAAGMVGPQSHGPLTPSFGAALISSTMPLFFAGVQYTDAAQRAWLIPRILDIEARTGFASAGLIAKGCEVSWERAAEAGRGPPYTARRERESADARKSGRVVEDLTPVSEFKEGGYVPLRDHSGESRYVHQSEEAGRLHWAMGLLADGQTLSGSDRRGT